MKITCDIIKDLLPLYADDMVSVDSKEMVEGHLANCAGCRAAVEDLKKSVLLPAETDTKALKKISKALRKKRSLSVVFTLLAVFSVLLGTYAYVNTPIYLTAEEAVETVVLDGADGAAYVQFRSGISGYELDYYYNNIGGKKETEANIVAYRYRLGGKSMSANVALRDNVVRVWYYDSTPLEKCTVIAGEAAEGYCVELEQKDMGRCAVILLAAGLLLMVMAIPVWKKKSAKVKISAGGFCISTAFILWMTTNGMFLAHAPGRVYAVALAMGAMVCGAIVTGWKIYEMNQ